MVDRASILHDIWQRNRLRRDSGLPAINVPKEYKFRLALAIERDFMDHVPDLTLRFAAERETIQAQVIADVRAKHGKEFPYTPAGHWSINHETRKRFDVFLRDHHGVGANVVEAKNPLRYGETAAPDSAIPPEQLALIKEIIEEDAEILRLLGTE